MPGEPSPGQLRPPPFFVRWRQTAPREQCRRRWEGGALQRELHCRARWRPYALAQAFTGEHTTSCLIARIRRQLQRRQRVRPLLIDGTRRHELGVAGAQFGVAREGRGSNDDSVRALGKVERLGVGECFTFLAVINKPCRFRQGQRGAQVHHRLGQRRIPQMWRPIDQCHLVVVVNLTVAERLEDPTTADHAEPVQLGRAQGAHTAGADDGRSFGDRIQELAMPDGRAAVKLAVDQHDCAWPVAQRTVDVPAAGRWAHLHSGRGGDDAGQRRSGEDDDAVSHRGAPWARPASTGSRG